MLVHGKERIPMTRSGMNLGGTAEVQTSVLLDYRTGVFLFSGEFVMVCLVQGKLIQENKRMRRLEAFMICR